MRTDGINEVAVSTIVENMFQYFDEDLIAENGRYWQLERGLKLRAALLVFFHYGLVTTSKPWLGGNHARQLRQFGANRQVGCIRTRGATAR